MMAKPRKKTATYRPPNFDLLVLAQVLDMVGVPLAPGAGNPLVHAVVYDLAQRKIVHLVSPPWWVAYPSGWHYSPQLARMLSTASQQAKQGEPVTDPDLLDHVMIPKVMTKRLLRYREQVLPGLLFGAH
jgi:hypothetical protein